MKHVRGEYIFFFRRTSFIYQRSFLSELEDTNIMIETVKVCTANQKFGF